MAHNIHHPDQPTYYIVLNGSNVISYGLLNPENCLDTPYDVETFLDQTDYNNRLIELGIDPNPSPEPSPIPDPIV